MIRTTALLFLLCVTPSISQQISSPLFYSPQIFDAQHYEAQLTIDDPFSLNVQGICNMSVRWLEGVDSPLLPFHLRSLIVDSVTWRGQRLDVVPTGVPAQDTFHYRIATQHNVVAGQVDTFTIYYHGRMVNEGGTQAWGGVWYEDQVLYALGVGFKSNYVSTTSHWLPCYDHPSDKATARLGFWIPKGLEVASVGTRTQWNGGNDDVLAYHEWYESHQIATYLLTFAIGSFTEMQIAGHPSFPHVVFSLARDTLASRVSYSLVPRMTQHFEELYGPYPFDKVGYVNTKKGAMEHQTMVCFPLSLVQSKDTVNTTAAHELAHMWWGDLVSPIDFRHVWLTESFATYNEAAWVEHLLGWNAYLNSMEIGANEYIKNIAVKEGIFTLFDFPREAPSSNYPQTIYRKGANVLAMARALAKNDSLFYGALRSFIDSHAPNTASTADMEEAMQSALGIYTEDFFAEWIDGKGWPQLSINLRPQDETTWWAEIQQVQYGQHPDWPSVFTTLPLNITYRDINGNLIDTMIVMEAALLNLRIGSPTDFSVNHGSKCRSQLEVVEVTTIMDPGIDNTRISIVPNPAHDSATLVRDNAHSPAHVEIVDINGRRHYTGHIHEGERSLPLSIASLSTGSYMVRITSEYAVTAIPLNIVR